MTRILDLTMRYLDIYASISVLKMSLDFTLHR